MQAYHEQRVLDGRNTARLLGDFYRSLEAQGIPEHAINELITMHYGRILNENALDDEFVFQFDGDDDDE